jgi:hypothetical protein
MPAFANASSTPWLKADEALPRGSTSSRTGTPAFQRAMMCCTKLFSSMNQKPTSIPWVSLSMRLNNCERQFSNDGSHSRSSAAAGRVDATQMAKTADANTIEPRRSIYVSPSTPNEGRSDCQRSAGETAGTCGRFGTARVAHRDGL